MWRNAVANLERMLAARGHAGVCCNDGAAVLFREPVEVAEHVRQCVFGLAAPRSVSEATLAMEYRDKWRMSGGGGRGARGKAVVLFGDFHTDEVRVSDGVARWQSEAAVLGDARRGGGLTLKGVESRVKAAMREALAAGAKEGIHVVVLHRLPLLTKVRADLDQMVVEMSRGPRLRVELWTTNYFAFFDPAKGTFPFARVATEELEAVLKRYAAGGAADAHNLPLLQPRDFMYRYLALRAGEVVRIVREDSKRGEYEVFRVAAPGL